MNKKFILLLMISSQAIFASVEDGTGVKSQLEFENLQKMCMESNHSNDKSDLSQFCQVIPMFDSVEDGTGNPSNDEGTGRPK